MAPNEKWWRVKFTDIVDDSASFDHLERDFLIPAIREIRHLRNDLGPVEKLEMSVIRNTLTRALIDHGRDIGRSGNHAIAEVFLDRPAQGEVDKFPAQGRVLRILGNV